MKFSTYTWQLYKQSDQGKAAIAAFMPECEDDCYNVFIKYNPGVTGDKDTYTELLETAYVWASDWEIDSLEDAKDAFTFIVNHGLRMEGQDVIFPQEYDFILLIISPLSFGLYNSSKFFIPNFFQYNFYALKKLVDYFELELPDYPKKSDYRARCMYYWELCEMFYKFRMDNDLSPEELCAFIYDFAPNVIGEQPIAELPEPTNAWFIGGVLQNEDKDPNYVSSWQANSETKRGDILIQYETAPISAITAIRIATTDGIIDPFFHWYTWAHMSQYTAIPPITLKELRSDAYFSTHSLVRKNFQGVNGWQITGNDYNELLRIIREKGGNADALPRLYAPPAPKTKDVKKERDVETELLEYYLGKLGFTEGRDYRRQLPIHAGRGHRVFPDYALHYDETPDYERARVLIEAKLEMKNNAQIEACFKQAYSYAKLLESSVIVLCDKNCLMIYEKKDSFDRDRYTKIYWGELESPDKFNELKNFLK